MIMHLLSYGSIKVTTEIATPSLINICANWARANNIFPISPEVLKCLSIPTYESTINVLAINSIIVKVSLSIQTYLNAYFISMSTRTLTVFEQARVEISATLNSTA